MTKPPTSNPTTRPPSQTKTRNRDRFRPAPQAGVVLQPRDMELLCDLFRHNVMSRGQLQALHYGSTPRCNFRLRQLFDAGFVSRHILPGLPCAQSVGVQVLYSIGKAALPVIALHLELEEDGIRRVYRRTRTPMFVQHSLSVGELRIAFHRAAIMGKIQIGRWLSEDESRHAFEVRAPGGAWRKELFKPDAFVRLQKETTVNDAERCYFLEADLGTTSQDKMLNKWRIHQLYLDSGLFRELYQSDTFRTLVVTTSVRRIENLLDLMEQQGSDLFWFTTFDEVNKRGILAPIWRSTSRVNQFSLFDEVPL